MKAMDRITTLVRFAVLVRKYVKPTPMTRSAPIVRCFSSVLLNQNTLAD